MADLYGTPAAESEEISNILSQLLHGSSNNYTQLLHSSAPPHTTASSHVSSAPDDFNFDSRRISSENDLGDSEKEPVASEAPLSSAPPRNSSKRSRAAEVHNMTEKRRRNKINEKMKALQNLIPNSNKTDKASMLDEAIEYLKQLQLQVQMLMMRNGLSLHPMCLPGVMQHAQLPLIGLGFEEGSNRAPNSNRASACYGNEENSMQSAYDISGGCTNLNQPLVIPSAANVPTLEASFSFEPSAPAYYRPFFDTTSSKELLFSDDVPPSDSNRTVINLSSDTDKVSSKLSKSPEV